MVTVLQHTELMMYQIQCGCMITACACHREPRWCGTVSVHYSFHFKLRRNTFLSIMLFV